MAATRPVDSAPKKHTWFAVGLSVVLPGLGHLYLGRYRRALLWLSPIALFIVGVALISRTGTSDLIGAALSPKVLWGLLGINVLTATWRVGASVDVYLVGASTRVGGSHRPILAVAGWVLVGVVVLVPHTFIGRLTVDALVLVDTVFVLEGEGVPDDPVIPIGLDADIVADPTPVEVPVPVAAGLVTPPSSDKIVPGVDEEQSIVRVGDDPRALASLRNAIFEAELGDAEDVAAWNKMAGERPNSDGLASFLWSTEGVSPDRITILLAGGDAGPGRGGMRTDTMMVATLDTVTGRAALFGFPRNLGHTPLPPRFQNAFVELQQRIAPDPSAAITNCKCFPEQLNALYPFTRKWTRTYPDEADPGMAALRDTLEYVMGIPIDYYVLADMAAFVDLVDAIDGVDVYVQKPLQAEVSPPREGDPWAKVDVDVGWNHLDGPQALAYARARKGSSDYVRMQRQRCMVRAVASKAQPLTLLRNLSAIVDALEGSVVTNVPLSQAPDLLTAAAKLDFEDIETVGFVHGYWEQERDHLGHPVPDLGRIRSKITSVMEGQSSEVVEEDVESECDA